MRADPAAIAARAQRRKQGVSALRPGVGVRHVAKAPPPPLDGAPVLGASTVLERGAAAAAGIPNGPLSRLWGAGIVTPWLYYMVRIATSEPVCTASALRGR